MGVVGGIGAKLLTKMGWVAGTGLGARRDGRVEPLAARRRVDKLGVGAERRPFQDAWWERTMEEAYGKPADTRADEDLLDACEGRRCRPHGSAKLERLEMHDRRAGVAEGGEEEVLGTARKEKKRKGKGKKDGKIKIRTGGVKKERKTKKKMKKNSKKIKVKGGKHGESS